MAAQQLPQWPDPKAQDNMEAQQLPQSEGIPENVRELILLNCPKCKQAVGWDGVGRHLRQVHNVDRSTSYTVNKMVRGPEWVYR